MCVFGRPCHPTPALLSCFPGKQEEDVGRGLFSQVASIHILYYTWILILQPSPSGSGRTAYNLHVTKAAYFPIYCVSKERGDQMLSVQLLKLWDLALEKWPLAWLRFKCRLNSRVEFWLSFRVYLGVIGRTCSGRC